MMNETAYYIFYLKEDDSIYAFTTEKEESIDFMKIRKKSIFLKEKRFLSMEERIDFLEKYSSCRLKKYKFTIKNIIFTMMLTYEEYLHIEGCGVMKNIIMTSHATIDPNIFNKKYFKALYDIGYIDSWMKWKYGIDDDINYDSFLFDIFMKEYGNTVSLDKLRKELSKCICI